MEGEPSSRLWHLLGEEEKEASEDLVDEGAGPGFLPALGMLVPACHVGDGELGGLRRVVFHGGSNQNHNLGTHLQRIPNCGHQGPLSESVPVFRKEKQWYLSTQHQRLHGGHSCGRPSHCSCTERGRTQSLCSARRPGRYCQCLVQSRHLMVQTQQSRIPAACTRPRHRSGPSCHHRRCPGPRSGKSLRAPRTGSCRSPGSGRHLGKEETGKTWENPPARRRFLSPGHWQRSTSVRPPGLSPSA